MKKKNNNKTEKPLLIGSTGIYGTMPQTEEEIKK